MAIECYEDAMDEIDRLECRNAQLLQVLDKIRNALSEDRGGWEGTAQYCIGLASTAVSAEKEQPHDDD